MSSIRREGYISTSTSASADLLPPNIFEDEQKSPPPLSHLAKRLSSGHLVAAPTTITPLLELNSLTLTPPINQSIGTGEENSSKEDPSTNVGRYRQRSIRSLNNTACKEEEYSLRSRAFTTPRRNSRDLEQYERIFLFHPTLTERKNVADEIIEHELELVIKELVEIKGVERSVILDDYDKLKKTISNILNCLIGSSLDLGNERFIFYPSHGKKFGDVTPIRIIKWSQTKLLATGSYGNVTALGSKKILKEAKGKSIKALKNSQQQLINEVMISHHLSRTNAGETPPGIQKKPRLVFLDENLGLVVHRYSNDLSKHTNFTLIEVVNGFLNVLTGLKFMHDQNIPHRDFKLPNIFVDGNGYYLGDFGEVLADFAKKENWATGTYSYMSMSDMLAIGGAQTSNDVSRGIELSKQADIFAAGLCLYILLLQNSKTACPYPRSGFNFCITDRGFNKKGREDFLTIATKYGEPIVNLIKCMIAHEAEERLTIDDSLSKLREIKLFLQENPNKMQPCF